MSTSRQRSPDELKNAFPVHAEVFERISDAFMALDKNLCYTYLNKKACEFSKRAATDLIGKHIWSEFPNSVGRPFYYALEGAMQKQKYTHLEDYYPETNKWFENHIYPSPQGVSIYFLDITDKKKLEIALKQSEERHRLLIEQSHDGIFIADFEGKILEGNSEACKMSGYTKEELLTKTLQELTPEHLRDGYPEFFSLMRQGTSVLNEGLLLKKDGSVLFVEISSQMTNDGKIAVFSRDIARRKKAEMELRETEERYRMLFEQSHDGIFIAEAEGKILEVNPMACRLSGYTKEELLTKTLLDLVPEPRRKEAPELFAILKKGELLFIEGDLLKKDGSILLVEISSQMTSDGKIAMFSRDITQRKETENELREAEAKFRDLVEKSLVCVYIIQDEKFAYVNPKFSEEYGYNRDELVGADIYSVVSGEPEIKKVAQNIKTRLAGEVNSMQYEMIGKRKDGSLMNVEVFGSRTTYKGKPAIIGTLINITERKKAEQELREAEEKFRNLVEQSLVGVYIIQDGRFVYVNPKLCEEYGYTSEELTGREISITAKDEEEMKKVNENIRARLMGEMDSVHYEMTLQRKDGNLIDVEVYGSRTQYMGRPAIIGTLINITERKQAELQLLQSRQKYKLLFERNPVPMWMFSKTDFSIIDVNEAACRLYGYSHEEFLKMNIRDMRPEEDIPRFIEKISETTTQTGQGIWRHKKKDGTIIYVEVTGNEIVYEGKPVRLALANDITSKLAAEEQLKSSYEEIRQLTKHLQNIREEERTAIAREIHDELGQQLTVLKMDIAWINRKLKSTDHSIKEKLEDLMKVLDGTVKTVRRISSELRPSLLDDLGLTAAVEWHLKEFEKRSGIKTRLSHSHAELPLDDSVKTALFRIIQESLTNVARHSGARNVKVNLLQQDHEVSLRIEDDGVGFNKEKTSQKRTLGILGMQERCAMIGGKYEISSMEGKGTAVLVTVPLVDYKQ